MAKVIRNQWVFKKIGHDYKYLPRRNEGPKEYDFKANAAGPENFPEKLAGEPPKLWLAWIFREPKTEPHWTKKRLEKLFGKDYVPGKMEIFKNTASVNEALWHVKHLIELRPLTFPNGEPTLDNVNSLEVLADGTCIIDRNITCDQSQLTVRDPLKQWKPGELQGRLTSRYNTCKDVFEDNVYTPSNISVVD